MRTREGGLREMTCEAWLGWFRLEQLSSARAGETRHSHKKLITAYVEEYVKSLAAAADKLHAASPSPSSAGVAGTGNSAADPLCLEDDDDDAEEEVVEVVVGSRQPHPSSSQNQRRVLGSVDLTPPEAPPLSMLERLQQQSTSPMVVAKRDLKRAGSGGGEPTPKRPPPAQSAEDAFMQFDETVSSGVCEGRDTASQGESPRW